MRYLVAVAALVLMTAPAVAGDPWTGAYAGAHIGYALGTTTTKDDIKDWCSPGDKACIKKYVGPFDYDTSGAFGGGTLGYNQQFDRLVLGFEGDLGFMDLTGAGVNESSHIGNHQNLTTSGGLYGDITARAGILVTPSVLVYGKGGWAWLDGLAAQTTTADGYVTHDAGNFSGWTAGGGAEWLLTREVSLKLEYQHFDFGSQRGDQTSISDPPIGHVYGNSNKLDADTVKVGVAYHF